MHKQVCIKINRWVDERISKTISILNQIPLLETIESCEGYDGKRPWICFHYGKYWDDSWKSLSNFVFGFMAPFLYSELGDSIELLIRATPSGFYHGELFIRDKTMINRVEKALHKMKKSINASLHHK